MYTKQNIDKTIRTIKLCVEKMSTFLETSLEKSSAPFLISWPCFQFFQLEIK